MKLKSNFMNNKTRKLIVITSLVYLLMSGLILTFIPQEIALFFLSETPNILILAFQLLGALYLGFGVMNYFKKNSLIGGIYNRPLVFGNFLHFLVGSFALIKMLGNYSENALNVILLVSIIYSLLTICFGYLLINNPIKTK